MVGVEIERLQMEIDKTGKQNLTLWVKLSIWGFLQ